MTYIGVSPSNGVRRVHTYTATGSQTSFTGASSEGITLSYTDANFMDVYQNGVLLAPADYTATSGTSVVLAEGAAASDIVTITVYDAFSVADTVSKSAGGTFDGNVAMAGTLGVTGVLTGTSLDISGDIDIDGTTNLDVVDIDGAVDMASTLSVGNTITSAVNGTMSNLILDNDADTPYMAFQESSTTNFFIGESSIIGGGGAGYYDFYGISGIGQRFFTNASERMRITSAGNVGIGTTSPNDTLHVNGNVFIEGSSPEITFETTGSSNNNWQIACQESVTNALEISVGSADADASNDTFSPVVVFNSSGNVGIGTSSPSSFYSLADNLVIGTGSGGHGLTIYSGSSDSGYIGFNDTASASMQGFIQYNHNGDYMAFAPNGSEKMRIDSNGKLLVNTTTGTGTVSITGTGHDLNSTVLKINNTSSATFVHSQQNLAPNLTANQTVVDFVGKALSTKNSGYIGYTWVGDGSNSNRVTFGHYGSDYLMNLTADGKLGIGTTSPDATLHLGKQNASLLLSNSNRSQYFRLQNNESTDAFTINANDTAERFRIDANGIMTVPAQPCFEAKSNISNVNLTSLSSGTHYLNYFNVEHFDINADYNTSNSTFTAPVAGRYFFYVQLQINNGTTSDHSWGIMLHFQVNGGGTYGLGYESLSNKTAGGYKAYGQFRKQALLNLSANDTVRVAMALNANRNGGDIETTTNDGRCRFGGYLIG